MILTTEKNSLELRMRSSTVEREKKQSTSRWNSLAFPWYVVVTLRETLVRSLDLSKEVNKDEMRVMSWT